MRRSDHEITPRDLFSARSLWLSAYATYGVVNEVSKFRRSLVCSDRDPPLGDEPLATALDVVFREPAPLGHGAASLTPDRLRHAQPPLMPVPEAEEKLTVKSSDLGETMRLVVLGVS